MNARKPMGLGEWLRLAEENLKAVVFLLGIVVTGSTLAGGTLAYWLRREMHKEVAPVLDAVTWKLDHDGDLPAYQRYKAHKDSLAHAIDSRTSSAGYPLLKGVD